MSFAVTLQHLGARLPTRLCGLEREMTPVRAGGARGRVVEGSGETLPGGGAV